MSDLSIEVKVLAGSDITKEVIPEMIRLATKLGCSIEANLNDVLTIAKPNDDDLALALAWRMALKCGYSHKMAFASDGEKLMEKSK